MENYDIAIVGGGIGGLMCAYRLSEKRKDLKIVLFERGHDLSVRKCPIVTKKAKKCMKCDPCNIMEGMGGAGAFSDGKYIISSEYGGWLPEVMESEKVIDYIEQADDILVHFGATTERFNPDNELKKECLKYDLHMQQAQVKHLGTDANFATMVKMVDM